MNNDLAPIVLFVYNRPEHTRKTVEALVKNELASESVLYVFADGAKENATPEQTAKVEAVREYIHTITGFKEVIIEESPKNKGLANSIIAGVTKVINEWGKVVVLEDDLVTHRFFLRFVNDSLDFYKDDKRIYDIGATSYNIGFPESYEKDVYIAHRSESCGWGTWADRWNKVDWQISDYDSFVKNKRLVKRFNRGGDDMAPMLKSQLDGKIDSWAIRWDYCMYKHNAYCLRPTKMLIQNTGFDGTGIHSGDTLPPNYYAEFYSSSTYDIKLVKNIKEDRQVVANFKKFQCLLPRTSYWKKTKRFVKNVISTFMRTFKV